MTKKAAASTLRRARTDEEELAEVAHEHKLQRLFFDAGLAGTCVPRASTRGLTPAHQRALNAELNGYEYPCRVQVPTFTPILAVLLEFGTEEQKLEHIPAILKGGDLWMQLLSGPSCGNDVAGAVTTGVRDGDDWDLNGSKVWTTGAWWSDWALCLAPTNCEASKQSGLTVFMFPIRSPGIEVGRIEMLNGPVGPSAHRRGADPPSRRWHARAAHRSWHRHSHSFVPILGDPPTVHRSCRARRTTIAFELAGLCWTDCDGGLAGWELDFLIRQATCIGGGTTEMAADVVSERVRIKVSGQPSACGQHHIATIGWHGAAADPEGPRHEGRVEAVPVLGGLHQDYRRAA